jgi:hypothetical protein
MAVAALEYFVHDEQRTHYAPEARHQHGVPFPLVDHHLIEEDREP